jgi:hypothetical protein
MMNREGFEGKGTGHCKVPRCRNAELEKVTKNSWFYDAAPNECLKKASRAQCPVNPFCL